jgi:hypothetical protein
MEKKIVKIKTVKGKFKYILINPPVLVPADSSSSTVVSEKIS